MDVNPVKFFKKIINSFFFGFLWMFAVITFGLYLKMGFITGALRWQNFLFYPLLVASLFLLIRYYYKSWK
jgi:hypothetical protein